MDNNKMVAIKNFTLPPSCYDCPLAGDGYCIITNADILTLDFNKTRIPNCPLCEIEIER